MGENAIKVTCPPNGHIDGELTLNLEATGTFRMMHSLVVRQCFILRCCVILEFYSYCKFGIIVPTLRNSKCLNWLYIDAQHSTIKANRIKNKQKWQIEWYYFRRNTVNPKIPTQRSLRILRNLMNLSWIKIAVCLPPHEFRSYAISEFRRWRSKLVRVVN